jgi:hypothetical protein
LPSFKFDYDGTQPFNDSRNRCIGWLREDDFQKLDINLDFVR